MLTAVVLLSMVAAVGATALVMGPGGPERIVIAGMVVAVSAAAGIAVVAHGLGYREKMRRRAPPDEASRTPSGPDRRPEPPRR